LVSTQHIREIGLASAFDDHSTIVITTGDLDQLLADDGLGYLLLDVSTDPNWMETQIMVRRVRPDIRQIVLGPAENDELILRSIAAGARGYLDSNSGPFSVMQAVETVVQGSIWAPRKLLAKLIDRLLTQHGGAVTLASPALSPRERQVLELIMSARSNREIAQELGIEERTVKAYVASLLKKTGAENRVSLSMQATQESFRGQRAMASPA
jgi:DNA-binding NarL/FixJ family response regulator